MFEKVYTADHLKIEIKKPQLARHKSGGPARWTADGSKKETYIMKIYNFFRFAWRTIKLVFSSSENMLYVARCLASGVRPIGRLHVLIRDALGNVKYREWMPNLVVNTGKYHIADQLSDQGEGAMSHMAIGTGTNAAAAGDTALQTELDRNALTSMTQGTGVNANKVTYIGDWAAGDGTGAITEAGIFNQASAGIMLCRSVFSIKNKGAGDSMTLTWVLTISA